MTTLRPDGAALAAVALTAALTAAPAFAEKLTPERLYAAPALSGPAARGVAISPDGRLVTYLKASPTDPTSLDLWAAATSGGEPRRLIEGKAVEPDNAQLSEAEKARRERQRTASSHGVLEYYWDEEGKAILVPAGGDLYLADAATGAVKRLTQTPADEVDAKISPKGRFVSFVRDQNLYVLPLGGGPERALTTAGQGAISYGVAEFIAQEEMARYTGYWWSPDDTRIAYTRVDETPVDVLPRFDIGATGTAIVEQRYPRAGRPNARVELYTQALDGGAPVKVDLGPDADIYLARVHWSKDGRDLYVERQTRDQQTLDLLRVDPATGRSRVILTERQAPWVALNNNFTALKDGSFFWGSTRSGFNHLYLYSRDGKLIRQVTHGDFEVAGAADTGPADTGVTGVDEAKGLVYFMASKESPLEHRLYVTSYRTPGEPRALTPGGGWWSVTMAKDTRTYVGGYSDPKTPPQTALYRLDGTRVRWVEENRLAPGHPYWPYVDHHAVPEYGRLKAADGQSMVYSLLKPTDFDPAKKYPVIVSVYGGPHAQTIRQTWDGGLDQLLAQQGFLIFKLDNRGSANRGLAFAAPIYKRLGGPEVEDQLVGVNFLRSLPYVDPKRIGVEGWSYGGFMTLRMMTDPRFGFAAGRAGAPPTDWRLYDTHYTEQFMGKPQDDPAAYDAAAVLPRLPKLSGRLLLMQGMADDNVTFDNSTRVMADLIHQGTVFDLMLYPGARHGLPGQDRKLQQTRTELEFFKRWLGGPQ